MVYQVIKIHDSTEMGFLVTNDSGSSGSEGIMQMPTTTSALWTTGVVDSRFDSFFGAYGFQDSCSGTIL